MSLSISNSTNPPVTITAYPLSPREDSTSTSEHVEVPDSPPRTSVNSILLNLIVKAEVLPIAPDFKALEVAQYTFLPERYDPGYPSDQIDEIKLKRRH